MKAVLIVSIVLGVGLAATTAMLAASQSMTSEGKLMSASARADAIPTTTVTLKVDGMHCGGCSSAVRGALAKVPGVVSSQVDHATGLAVVTIDGQRPPTNAQLVDAVTAIKYGAKVE